MKEKAYRRTLDRLGRARQDPNVTRDQSGRWLWNRGLSSTHYDLVSVHHSPLSCVPHAVLSRDPLLLSPVSLRAPPR